MRQADEFRLAVGFFDGVHLGHRAILAGADAALTFDVHPLSILAPETAPRLLESLDERIAAIHAAGVADVRVLAFDRLLSCVTAEDFVPIMTRLVPEGRRLVVRCGANWRFGRGGEGDAAFLNLRGVATQVVAYAETAGEPVSSSRIRRALAEGDATLAATMLGRPYAVRGAIVAGKGLGRTLGYPTLNLQPGRLLPLRRGVWAVRIGSTRGVANYGLAPTAGAKAWREDTLEVHLLDMPSEYAPGESVEVTFGDYLREERTFASLDALKTQISIDCENAKKGQTK